ncbi:unnamed protein product [Zymoseptoria tritici ST99CH_3D7]|uniref:ASST-domain-containing protein n=1 Tax=Zymoseptoria tritici (strain ST99CH_3D7) TaxID=1276538 RepID=A0A1X7RJS0_ZYMT9|nr:unnamed protein product [Zymoseptoria tritici ST99CH_3D7]
MAWATWSKYLWKAAKWTLWTLLGLFSLYLLHQFFLPIVAFVFPTLDPQLFDLGVFGAYPTQHYSSFHLQGPLARRPIWDATCDQGLVLLNPNGPSVDQPGPMILNGMGDLIWSNDDFGETANLKVQHWQGKDYLTMWSGEKAATSGKGVYFMLDETYEVVKMVTAAGEGLFGDLHEFKITPEGTGLLTVYNTTSADLTGMGMWRGADGWIVDNMFQEINLETGELIFQWKASDHFKPIETYMTNPFGGYSESIPFDWYHLNSIDKDSQGNYIISSRHFHHVVCISPTGETLWILGGRDNQFTDLSDGEATNFKWSHDARWYSEEDGILSLFDNQKAGPLHIDASNSRGLLIQLDIPNKTAKVVHQLVSLQGILASSQGSVQRLPSSDHIFVGWGAAAAYSEYTADGELLCETHLGAAVYYSYERFKSYRATKVLNWVGTPKNPPDVEIEDDTLYVSWNGATEVAFWALESDRKDDLQDFDLHSGISTDIRSERLSGEEDGTFEMIDIIPRSGFEGSFQLPTTSSLQPAPRFRIAALDKNHNVLRFSAPITYDSPASSHTWMLLFKLFLVVGFLFGARIMFRQARAAGWLKGWKTSASTQGRTTNPAWMEWRLGEGRRWKGERAVEWVQMKWMDVTGRGR